MNLDLIEKSFRDVTFLKEKLSDKEILEIQTENDIYKLPLLEKEEVVEDSLILMPSYYLPLLMHEKLIRNDTSGSTGKYLNIYWRRQDYIRSMYSLWFYRKYFYGIYTWDKMCQFFSIFQTGFEDKLSRKIGNRLEFSKSNLTDERLLDIYHEMQEFQPKWLLLQPCIAELLCYIKNKYNLNTINSIEYIEMTGEELTIELRNRILDNFKCFVANQYGANEVNSIAFECPNGKMHCMEDNVFVEVLDDDGNPVEDGNIGNIYVTTAHNYAMPFIRYGIGDIGSLEPNNCSCGHKGKILQLESGRKDDWIKTREGKKINPYVFIRAVVAVNAAFDGCIYQFQVIQETYDQFTVKLAVDDELEGISQFFIDNIGDDKLKTAEYQFVFLEKMFPEINGKRKFFKCMIEKGG